jgi:propionate CoA-transferase
LKEGSKKFIDHVEQITFSGKYAAKTRQPVFYVTERAVFTLEDGEMTLIEIAPGIDLENDILKQMEFRPKISDNLKTMDSGIFQEKWGRLEEIIKGK